MSAYFKPGDIVEATLTPEHREKVRILRVQGIFTEIELTRPGNDKIQLTILTRYLRRLP